MTIIVVGGIICSLLAYLIIIKIDTAKNNVKKSKIKPLIKKIVIKGKIKNDFHLRKIIGNINSKHKNIELDIEHKKISNSLIPVLTESIINQKSLVTQVRYLNLANNHIGGTSLEVLIGCLKQLITLDLSSNNIFFKSENSTSSSLVNNASMKIQIMEVDIFIKFILNYVEHENSSLEKINLSNNFINEECELKLATLKNNLFFNLIKNISYYSHAYSLIDNIREKDSYVMPSITPVTWVVAMARLKNDTHTILLLEGMYRSGQRFLMKLDIRVKDMASFWVFSRRAEQKKLLLCPSEFRRTFSDTYKPYLIVRPINYEQGNRLISSIPDKGFIDYTVTASFNSENCLIWCIHRLQDIGIALPEPESKLSRILIDTYFEKIRESEKNNSLSAPYTWRRP